MGGKKRLELDETLRTPNLHSNFFILLPERENENKSSPNLQLSVNIQAVSRCTTTAKTNKIKNAFRNSKIACKETELNAALPRYQNKIKTKILFLFQSLKWQSNSQQRQDLSIFLWLSCLTIFLSIISLFSLSLNHTHNTSQ